jgi:hypothetical protein
MKTFLGVTSGVLVGIMIGGFIVSFAYLMSSELRILMDGMARDLEQDKVSKEQRAS